MKLFLDGQLIDQSDRVATENTWTPWGDNADPWVLARHFDRDMEGRIDEFRIARGHARSKKWVVTEYTNHRAPTLFLSIGTKQKLP